jgi:hypothetical protein
VISTCSRKGCELPHEIEYVGYRMHARIDGNQMSGAGCSRVATVFVSPMPEGIWSRTGRALIRPFGHNLLDGPLRLRRSREHTPNGRVMGGIERS